MTKRFEGLLTALGARAACFAWLLPACGGQVVVDGLAEGTTSETTGTSTDTSTDTSTSTDTTGTWTGTDTWTATDTTTTTWTTTTTTWTTTTTTWTTTTTGGCEGLTAALEQALEKATNCNACTDGPDPCDYLSGPLVADVCGCPLPVNVNKPEAVKIAVDAYAAWTGKGCGPYLCEVPCAVSSNPTCQPSADGCKGTCAP